MTKAAWIFMLTTWSVIALFTGRFFWKILTAAPERDDGEDGTPPKEKG